MTINPFAQLLNGPEYPSTHKLTADKVRAIRRAYKRGKTQQELAEEYSVKQSSIHRIVKYKTWFHVTDE